MSRPELQAPPDIYYNTREAQKYGNNTRIIKIQTKMAVRAIELLNLKGDVQQYILDIGCGSGLSGEALTDNGNHIWVGMDISQPMLGVAIEREVEGDLIYHDMGQGVHFRPGTFDGAISVSALQWLCNADCSTHNPWNRLKVFFQSLYQSLARGARAIFQLYPQTPEQMSMITNAAMRTGFSGGLVVDFPNSSKAKKIFLCLFAGDPNATISDELPKGLDDPTDTGGFSSRQDILFTNANRTKGRKTRKRKGFKDRDWAQGKKERQRKQGKKVANDSRYSYRKRNPKW